MTSAQICILIAIIAYLAMLLYLGFRCSKASNSTSEFYLGGRQLGPYVTAMSAEASDMSSWLLMGLPGLAYTSGLCDVGWTAIGIGIGTYLNWLIVAKRLRHYTAVAGDSVTVPDFFENRFRDKSHLLLGISALAIVVFFVPYTASGFAACGKLFSSLFGMNYMAAMLISAAVIVIYTAMGGFLAASLTDFVQSIVMTIALIIVLIFGFTMAGGVSNTFDYAATLQGYLSMVNTHDAATNTAVSYGGFLTIFSTACWGLGYFGMPHILLRFMGISDPKKLKVSRRVATVWVFISMFIAVLIGVVGLTMVHEGAIEAVSDSERILIMIATKLSSFGIIPALLAGVVMAGILACTMSTCDSQLLAASSSVSENILKGVFGMKISDKTSMIIARITLVGISVIGAFMARDPDSSVFQIVSFAWAGFGGAFGAVVLCALFWRRANRWGALAGMIGGGVMVFVWKFAIKPLGGVFGIYELLPAFLFSLILIVVVSLLTPAPSKEITDEFDKVKAIKD
jgi:sodium/proline symporter